MGLLVFGTIYFFLGHICIGTKGIGTKCSWDIQCLGQNVSGTFGVWDKSLDFRIFLGQNVFGTIHLGAKGQWDNSPSY